MTRSFALPIAGPRRSGQGTPLKNCLKIKLEWWWKKGGTTETKKLIFLSRLGGLNILLSDVVESATASRPNDVKWPFLWLYTAVVGYRHTKKWDLQPRSYCTACGEVEPERPFWHSFHFIQKDCFWWSWEQTFLKQSPPSYNHIHTQHPPLSQKSISEEIHHEQINYYPESVASKV